MGATSKSQGKQGDSEGLPRAGFWVLLQGPITKLQSDGLCALPCRLEMRDCSLPGPSQQHKIKFQTWPQYAYSVLISHF